MKRIILKPHEERRILQGHPWVYDNEVSCILAGSGAKSASVEPACLEPGECAEVESSDRKYLGRSFVNPNSKIIARIYSPSKEGADKGFFKNRLRKAVLRRSSYDLRRESARLVFAEADFLPGLIIDRFVGWPLEALEATVAKRPVRFEEAEAALGSPASWISAQFLSWGMDERREMILEALEEVLAAPLLSGQEPLPLPAGIVEKSGAKVRELEGLAPREGIVKGSFPPAGIVIFENALPFAVHLEEGQKTGHFLDQRDNRRMAEACLASRLPAGRVLDVFAYSGGFGIHAAGAGADSVVCVDASAPALETLKKNAALNGVAGRVKTVQSDAFEYLRAAERKREQYDLVILDPPAFAKTRASLDGAIRGYKEINLRAISLIRPGGILITCSCSQAVDETLFKRMVTDAAADAEKRLVQLDFRYQACDHPILMGYDESHYLKCGFYMVL